MGHVTCPECCGTTVVPCQNADCYEGYVYPNDESVTCPDCEGEDFMECPECVGTGWLVD